MVEMMAGLLGGVGLFITGMILLTESLKNLAGENIKNALKKFTGGIGSAILSGVVLTAVLQSSHATILTTIGFVSAGLLSFQQSIGIILGANLGTTSTGWIVSLIGFKLSMGKLVFPLIGIGSIAKLLSKGKTGEIGIGIVGFGLLFLGIDSLQLSMKSVATIFNPAGISSDSFLDKFALVFSGIGMTVVMQSSSAALATTLSAVNENAINVTQACYMVIGQNIGTTLTAGIAAIGGAISAKRTALIHVVFNVVAAVIAFLILQPMMYFMEIVLGRWNMSDPVTTIATFHSLFNLIGVLFFIPFIQKFTNLVERIMPEDKGNSIKNLDPILYNSPAVAMDAVVRSVFSIYLKTILSIENILNEKPNIEVIQNIHKNLREELSQSLSYMEKIPHLGISRDAQESHTSVLHAIDHLHRLIDCLDDFQILYDVQIDSKKEKLIHEMNKNLILLKNFESTTDFSKLPVFALEEKSKYIANYRKEIRLENFQLTAGGEIKALSAMKEIDYVRWFDKVYFYLWRISHHFKIL
jgi:phosphate:Na+ symporter